jgi:putative transposase
VERIEESIPTGKAVGIDVGLNHFHTDSNGEIVPKPRYLSKSEKALKRLPRRVYRKKKGFSNRKKNIKKLGRKHLQVSKQRKDLAIETALCVVNSSIL